MNFLRDRDREIWKPLFALCQVFVPERLPELERSAIDIATLKTSPVRRFEHLKDEEERARKLEYAEHLLLDALTVIGQRDRIASADLVRGLREIATSPWRSYEGSGISDISLASMLKLFGVEPKTIRFKPKSEQNSTAKGYHRASLVAGAGAAAGDSAVVKERNPVTHPGEKAAKSPETSALNLPILDPCGGCREMHRGIAEMALASPDLSDEGLAAKSGCSLAIVRQAKMRHLDWKKESE
jgi:hypothetical protein